MDASGPEPPARAAPASPSGPEGAAEPDFGPSGYLPGRAARRARKIVLRAPLGLSWVVASILAGVVVVAAGTTLLVRAAAPPPAPWVALGPLATLPTESVDPTSGALVVAVGGRVRAFDGAAGTVRHCAASGRLEAADGRVWALTGRGHGGTASLVERPVLVHDGTVYLDPTRTLAPLDPDPTPRAPAC